MTAYRTLISAANLKALQAEGAPLVLLDCSHDLAQVDAGAAAWAAGHLPGSVHAHLDHDLAAPKTGRNGRHPLPSRQEFAVTAGRWGIRPGVQVVTFDDQGGPYAARAWWMLHWLGHDAVAVLDGGLATWRAAGGTLTTDPTVVQAAAPYPLAEATLPSIDATSLLQRLGQVRVLDARAGERFRGDVEPLDPVAGHIPGASNRFFKDNLQPDGRFKSADTLNQEFRALGTAPDQVVHQCGSGVTGCHNLLAMTHAGLEGSVLYPGSWSEWCADPVRPVARG